MQAQLYIDSFCQLVLNISQHIHSITLCVKYCNVLIPVFMGSSATFKPPSRGVNLWPVSKYPVEWHCFHKLKMQEGVTLLGLISFKIHSINYWYDGEKIRISRFFNVDTVVLFPIRNDELYIARLENINKTNMKSIYWNRIVNAS